MKELPVRWIEASTPGIGGVRAGDAKRTGSVYAEGSAAQPWRPELPGHGADGVSNAWA